MSVSAGDNFSKCSRCGDKYDDQYFDDRRHPLTGNPLCSECAEDSRCKDCGHVGCEGVIVSGICMGECVECKEVEAAA